MPTRPDWQLNRIPLFADRLTRSVPLRKLLFEPLEPRELLALVGLSAEGHVSVEIEPNDAAGTANLIPVRESAFTTRGELSPGDVDLYRFHVRSESEQLIARVRAVGVDTRLSLLDANLRLLIQSEGQSVNADGRIVLDPDDSIVQHLLGSSNQGDEVTFFLKVEAVAGEAGTYELESKLSPSVAPFQQLTVGNKPSGVVTADFDEDGLLDLAVTNNVSSNVSILLGLGDGTFAPAGALVFPVGRNPEAIATGRLNADKFLDLAVVNESADSVSVLYGLGNGVFAAAQEFPVGEGMERPSTIALGQFGDDNGDKKVDDLDRLDIVTANEATGEDTISILFQDSPGVFNFKKSELSPDGSETDAEKPEGVLPADFDQDGLTDLATLNPDSETVSVLFNAGDNKFEITEPIELPDEPARRISSTRLVRLARRHGLIRRHRRDSSHRNYHRRIRTGKKVYCGRRWFESTGFCAHVQIRRLHFEPQPAGDSTA